MRIFRSIAIFAAGLGLIGLIAVNVVLAARTPQGPDLGPLPEASGVQEGPEREARLFYMGQILGRWSPDGRCRGEGDQWIFARRRILSPDGVCEIRRFLPGSPVDLDLHNCSARDETGEDMALENVRQIALEISGERFLSLRGDINAELERCI